MGYAFGYARVSTTDQDAQLQHDALTADGYYRIFTDTASGALQSRPELKNCSTSCDLATPWWCGDSTAWVGRVGI